MLFPVIERLFNSSKIVEKSLDATWLRNEAISQNIANIDTPGYKRKKVSFEEYLSSAMDEKGFDKKNGGSVDDIEIKVTEDNKYLSYRLDENNVDIDNEMASLAKNNIQYNTLIQRMNASFRNLKSAISEGRRW